MVQLVENLVKIFTSGKFMSIFTSGLLMTVEMSLGAAVLGLVLGTVVALVNLSKSKSPLMVLPLRTIDHKRKRKQSGCKRSFFVP